MFTSFDKAIAALVGSIISIIVLFGVSVPEQLSDNAFPTMVATIVNMVIVWLVPNKASG